MLISCVCIVWKANCDEKTENCIERASINKFVTENYSYLPTYDVCVRFSAVCTLRYIPIVLEVTEESIRF